MLVFAEGIKIQKTRIKKQKNTVKWKKKIQWVVSIKIVEKIARNLVFVYCVCASKWKEVLDNAAHVLKIEQSADDPIWLLTPDLKPDHRLF